MAHHEIATRIETVLKHYGLTASQLAENIGIQRSSISHILSGRNKPSLDLIMKLVGTYSDLNLYWLVMGTQPMLQLESQNKVPLESENDTPAECAFAGDEIEQIVIFYRNGCCKRYVPDFKRK